MDHLLLKKMCIHVICVWNKIARTPCILSDACLNKIGISMEATKQSEQNSERDIHTGQMRLSKDIFAMMDTAIRGPPAFLIISQLLPDLYSSIVTG